MPRSRKPEIANPGSGLHTYVVAEVNGHADLLRHFLNAIDRVARRMSWTYRVVFIGDVIDFGPHSKQAMDIVSETLKRLPGSCLILGDHEVLLLKLLDEVDWNARQKLLIKWLDDLGGSVTLASYGFTGRPDELERIKQMIGRDHVSVLRQGVRYVELEHHVLVHASFEPGIALEDQDPDRMLLCPPRSSSTRVRSARSSPWRSVDIPQDGRSLSQSDFAQHRCPTAADPFGASH